MRRYAVICSLPFMHRETETSRLATDCVVSGFCLRNCLESSPAPDGFHFSKRLTPAK